MKVLPSLRSEVIYARDLVKAGLDAAPSAGDVDAGRVSQSAIAPAALGAALGVLTVYLSRNRRLGNEAILGGVLGCALGFTSAIAWGTRGATREWSRKAAANVGAVRDARWIEKNPVAYA